MYFTAFLHRSCKVFKKASKLSRIYYTKQLLFPFPDAAAGLREETQPCPKEERKEGCKKPDRSSLTQTEREALAPIVACSSVSCAAQKTPSPFFLSQLLAVQPKLIGLLLCN